MFMAIGIIGFIVGLICVLVSKEKWESLFKQANATKGTEMYSDENIAKRIKLVKIAGPIGLIFGGLLIIMELTGF
ncbi:MAG: hypothetical protein FWE19_06510 [Oscillospiraceae bacterium]|nr:hypothetical protein [Oscillospiraceae bacterium]